MHDRRTDRIIFRRTGKACGIPALGAVHPAGRGIRPEVAPHRAGMPENFRRRALVDLTAAVFYSQRHIPAEISALT